MNGQTQTCPLCGQPKASGTAGSFTQWIAVCRCEQTAGDVQTGILCGNCGKKIQAAEAGSFTAWVFDKQSCQCEEPLPLRMSGDSLSVDDARQFALQELTAESFPLERYRPIQVQGIGGTGAVYRCFDEHLKREVALKVLRATTDDMLLNFQEEARVTAKFHHPNVVSILDFGVTEGRAPYMVLEYVDGAPLSSLIEKEGPLQPMSALEIFLQITSAIAQAHDSGIFHRDITSRNILISKEASGDLKANIIDFGIAMLADQKATRLRGLTVVGTPNYMSADQFLGRPYDARSEIYSLGCVLYETLSGRLPFTGDDSIAILRKHAEEPVKRLTEYPDIEVPAQFEHIVMKCLEKKPEDRYQSAKEVQGALLRLLADSSSSVSSAVSPALSGKQSTVAVRPNLYPVVAVAVIAIVLMIVIPLTLSHDKAETGISSISSKPVASVRKSGLPVSVRKEIAPIDLSKLSGMRANFEKDLPFEEIETCLTTEIDAAGKESANRQADLYRMRGIARKYLGKYDSALSDLDNSVKRDPKNAANYRARAALYVACDWQGESRDWRKDLTKAIELAPKDIENYIDRAQYYGLYPTKAAREAIAEALKLKVDEPRCYAIRAYQSLLTKNFDSAERDMIGALETGSDDALVCYFSSLCLMQSKKFSAYLSLSEKASRLSPHSWEPYHNRSSYYILYDENEEKSLANLNKAIDLNPKNATLFYARSLVNRRIEALKDSLGDVEKAIALKPDVGSYHATAGSLYLLQRKPDLALASLDEAIRLGDVRAPVQVDRAYCLASLGRTEEAEKVLSGVIAKSPEFPKSYRRRAQLRYELGRYKEAADDYSVAIKLQPQDARLWEGRAMSYEKMGMFNLAKQDRSHTGSAFENALNDGKSE